jgi:hypothetical protein
MEIVQRDYKSYKRTAEEELKPFHMKSVETFAQLLLEQNYPLSLI